MGSPIGVLKRVMSAREFAHWCWVFEREPFDDQRRYDLPAAMQVSHALNLHLKEGAEPFSVFDFMPFHKTPAADEDQPPEDVDAAVIGRL